MPVLIPDVRLPGRGRSWKWCVCLLLLLATMINYMDRQTLSQMADRILTEFALGEKEYGRIESAFALAFALGALLMGWLADRVNVRRLYPLAVLAWSGAGFATGYANGFASLLLCRFLLGLAESGNWPCALRTTQAILPPAERTLGNSLLQSGASLGALLTPYLALVLVGWTGSWRPAFFAVGAAGLVWVFLWLSLVRSQDLALTRQPLAPTPGANGSLPPPAGRRVFLRRYAVLVVVVVMINTSWHFFRAWLPLFLQRQHHYSEWAAGLFTSAYYLATDLGALSVGFVSLALVRKGMSVHASRMLVFLACCVLTALSVAASVLPAGPGLLALLLLIGFGALGLFPTYYSFSQELSVRHQGKVTGTLGCTCWLALAGVHELVGNLVQQTGSYRWGVALAGLAPLAGFVALLLFWGPDAPSRAAVALPPDVQSPTDERIQGVPGATDPRVQKR